MFAKAETKSPARLSTEQTELARINARLAELDDKLNALLIEGDNAAIEKLDADVAALRKEAGRRQRTISLLEKERHEADRALAVKRKAEVVALNEAVFRERAKNFAKMEAAIESLLDCCEADKELSARFLSGWAWSNNEREVLAPFADGLYRLLCHQFQRASRLRFLVNGGGGKFRLPGAVCPRDDWDLDPEKIPSLTTKGMELAVWASGVMRRNMEKIQ